MTSSSARSSRVVIAVANTVTPDARVRKYAQTAALAGLDVTVVGLSDGTETEEGRLGDARLLRVPVRYRLRDAAARQRDPDHRARSLEIAAYEQRARERELSAEIGSLKARGRTAWYLERRRIVRRIGRLRAAAARERATFDADVVRERAEIAALRALREVSPDTLRPRPRREVDWRGVAPEFLDLEIALGPVIDDLDADVLHAHDVHLLGVLARAKRRARGAGREVRLVYDSHEYIRGLFHADPDHLDALASMESEFIHDADEVVAVSARVAEELRRTYALPTTPAVVRNAPVIGPRAPDLASLRAVTGVGPHDVLLVYSGGVNPGRGLEVLVDALALLPDRYHAVLVTNRPRAAYTATLLRRARDAGIGARLHTAPFVVPDQVVHYLADADIGIDPMRSGWRNHEWTLTNKLFEYTAAGLGVVVGDLAETSRFVQELGNGVVFPSGDPAALAAAVERVEPRRAEIRQAAERRRVLWSDEVEAVLGLYEVSGTRLAHVATPTRLPAPQFVRGTGSETPAAPGERTVRRLAIGPVNAAGQAWAWKGALEAGGGVRVEVFTLEHDAPYDFDTDHRISTKDWGQLDWQLAQAKRIITGFSHVLFEFGRPLLGRLHSKHFDGDARMLAAHGLRVGMICHGSDVRDPDLHIELEPFSPFRSCSDEFREGFARRTRHLRELLADVGLPVFVTTPGLLDHVPTATWLPLVVDVDRFSTTTTPAGRSGPLRVGHFPTRGIFKGSAAVDRTCGQLHDEGVIDYVRLAGEPSHAIPRALHSIDVLVDGLVLGDYGALACQAMAAGRAVVGNVGRRVRDRLPLELPLVHATPDTIEGELRRLAVDAAEVRRLGAAGQDYVRVVHDGARARDALSDFLDGGGET